MCGHVYYCKLLTQSINWKKSEILKKSLKNDNSYIAMLYNVFIFRRGLFEGIHKKRKSSRTDEQ